MHAGGSTPACKGTVSYSLVIRLFILNSGVKFAFTAGQREDKGMRWCAMCTVVR